MSEPGKRPVEVTPGVVLVRADNPGPMTLDGTNTWVLHRPDGTDGAFVVDPGPRLPEHLDAITAVAEPYGGVELVLVTHHHPDHAESAVDFATRAHAPLRAADPAYAPGGVLTDGETLAVAGLTIEVVATPGHTADSVSFVLGDSLLTGDTVLGRGTTVVAHPDGALGPYLDSLHRLQALARDKRIARILPGHGPVLEGEQVAAVLDGYLRHRAERLDEIRAAVADGLTEPRAIVESVYAEVDRSVWPAAEMSVRAQLEYLNADVG